MKQKTEYFYQIKIKNNTDITGVVQAYSEKQARMFIIMKNASALRQLVNYEIIIKENEK